MPMQSTSENSIDKGIHAFLKHISPKVNVIARLEFDLAYYDVALTTGKLQSGSEQFRITSRTTLVFGGEGFNHLAKNTVSVFYALPSRLLA